MITVPITLPWHVCTPTIFRLLPSQYVDEFFRDGSLRLSSFRRFKQHTDEQRLDAQEGESSFVHRTRERRGQTFFARALHGDNAYVLSANLGKEIKQHFGDWKERHELYQTIHYDVSHVQKSLERVLGGDEPLKLEKPKFEPLALPSKPERIV